MSAQCSKTFSGTVIDDNCFDNASPLPSGNVGSAYSEQLTASALTAPMTFIVLNGTLPDGTTLDADTGEIYGVPTLESSFSFQAQVMDSSGLRCVKNFTLQINAAVSNCGWWDDFVWDAVNQQAGDPVGSSNYSPANFTGMSGFTMSVQQPFDVGWVSPELLEISGTKNYTGGAVILKIVATVTVAQGMVDSGDGLRLLITTGSPLLDEQIQSVGTFTYLVTIPESAAVSYLFSAAAQVNSSTGAGDFQCSVTIASYQASTTSLEWVNAGTDPQFYFTPVAFNPAATITVLSSADYTWDLGSVFHAAVWAVPPTVTLDGVPLTLHMSGPNWVCDITSFSTVACVPRVFQISGPTAFDPTGLGAFHIVGPN